LILILWVFKKPLFAFIPAAQRLDRPRTFTCLIQTVWRHALIQRGEAALCSIWCFPIFASWKARESTDKGAFSRDTGYDHCGEKRGTRPETRCTRQAFLIVTPLALLRGESSFSGSLSFEVSLSRFQKKNPPPSPTNCISCSVNYLCTLPPVLSYHRVANF